jgi:hypothetical protein
MNISPQTSRTHTHLHDLSPVTHHWRLAAEANRLGFCCLSSYLTVSERRTVDYKRLVPSVITNEVHPTCSTTKSAIPNSVQITDRISRITRSQRGRFCASNFSKAVQIHLCVRESEFLRKGDALVLGFCTWKKQRRGFARQNAARTHAYI